ncbi:MAG: DUF167 domain-containing protein [Candidatus Micrarchaeota archaeon]
MIVEVTVAPNSKRFSLSVKDGRLKAALKSPPENNRANIELIKGLSKALGAPVRIISGQTSKRKKLDIAIDEDGWGAFLRGLREQD